MTCQRCLGEFPEEIELDGVFISLKRRNCCLDCVPFRRRVRRTDPTARKRCPKCKSEKDASDFYQSVTPGGVRLSTYCKTCQAKQMADRPRRFKEQCVEYKGGRCEVCGYNRYFGALDFHHRDPTLKEFKVSSVNNHTFDDRVKSELDKCSLVCKCCHSEIHAGVMFLSTPSSSG